MENTVSNPGSAYGFWLWAFAAAVSLGLAFGFGIRFLLTGKQAEGAQRSRSIFFSSAFFFMMSAGIAALVGFMILAPQTIFSNPAFMFFSGASFAIGICSSMFPRAFGIPSGILCSVVIAVIGIFSSAYLPASERATVARFLPYGLKDGLIQGEIEFTTLKTSGSGLGMVMLAMELPPEAVLRVEMAEFGGPLAALFGRTRYRILGFSPVDGLVLPGITVRATVLDGLKSADGTIKLPWIRTRIASSDKQDFVMLERIRYVIGPDATILSEYDKR